MNLLINKDGVIVGQTLSPENAHRHAMTSRMRLFVVTNRNDFKKLPVEVSRALNEDFRAKSIASLLAMLSKQTFPQWGKVSVKDVVRKLYADGKCELTRDELISTIPGATWISITTAFSMLKNKKYADGDLMFIEQINGKYRRRK